MINTWSLFISREQIIKLEAPKVDSGYTAHVSHRPEFENKHFQQWIEGALITETQGVVSYPREEVMERSHTVPENLLLADYQDLDLGNMREDVVFTKEYLDSLDTPVRRSLMRLRERQIRDRYAFQAKDNQRVRTRDYLHKQLTRTNYISSSLSVMMAAGDQTTFERDLTWKTARKIEILRNKSRSTPLVPYGILYPRIGGVTRFQGRPTKGEISLIEKRVENMSKNIVDNKEQLKAWKQSEIPEPEIILDSKPETRNISALDLVTPCEKRQIAEDEAKIFRMKNSFEKLPNIDTRTAEILARSITEEERREKEAGSTNELMSMSHDFKTEARRGKMPKGTLYKSSLTQKDKNSDSKDPKSDQFGLGRVNLPNPPSQKKQARRTVRMRPVFPVKEKAPPSFEFTEDVKTPSHGNLPLQKDELGVDNKVFITQPRENSNFLIGAEDATESLTRANSGKKSVTFDESINRNEDSENNDENSAANETTMEENVLENQENGKTKENVQGIEQNENEEVSAKKNAAEATPDRQETHETLESLTAEAQTEESTFQVTPEDGLQTIQESPTE